MNHTLHLKPEAIQLIRNLLFSYADFVENKENANLLEHVKKEVILREIEGNFYLGTNAGDRKSDVGITLFAVALTDIINNAKSIKDKSGNMMVFAGPIEAYDLLSVFSENNLSYNNDDLREILDCILDTKADIHAVYVHLFKRFFEWEIEWIYRSDYLNSLSGLAYLAGESLDESTYYQFLNEGPEAWVIAYTEVFSAEPWGYPPKLSEYRMPDKLI